MDHFVIISMSTPVMNCILQLFISLFVSNRTLASAFSTLLLKASNTFSILLLQFFCLSSSRTITQNTPTHRHIRSPPPLRHWHTYTSHHNGALIFCFVMLWRSLKLWHTHTHTYIYSQVQFFTFHSLPSLRIFQARNVARLWICYTFPHRLCR